MSEPIEDYVQEQRKYIPEQYKQSTKLLWLIDSALVESNDIETALREINECFNIDDAVGPMLDYYAAYFGITRNVGETDTQLRKRVRMVEGIDGLPTKEAIYNYFKFAVEIENVLLCSVWPAGIYFIVDADAVLPSLESLERIVMASGVSLGRGAFLAYEDLELLIDDDYGLPIICDYTAAT